MLVCLSINMAVQFSNKGKCRKEFIVLVRWDHLQFVLIIYSVGEE